jgi:hypothetical protein
VDPSLHIVQASPLTLSFVENPADPIEIVVWNSDQEARENLAGTCMVVLPDPESNDQQMSTNWYPLTREDAKETVGKIRLGIQYLYDQVKMYDTLLHKKENDRQTLVAELDNAQRTFDETSRIPRQDLTRRPVRHDFEPRQLRGPA